MKSLNLYTLIFLTLLMSCTKEPLENKEIVFGSTYEHENLTTTIKYYNINRTDLSLSETSQSPFFANDTTSQNNFEAVILQTQGIDGDVSNSNAFINSVEFMNEEKINLNIIALQGLDTINIPIDCIYEKISPRIYRTESCSINEIGQLTFYYDNNILSHYSQVILLIKTGTNSKIVRMEARFSSTEDLNSELQTYLDENPLPEQVESKIAIAQIKRNYRKL